MPPPRPPGWADDHDDDHDGASTEDEAFWTPPRAAAPAPFVPRIALVGAGNLAYRVVAGLLRECAAAGIAPLVIVKNGTVDEAAALRRSFGNRLDPARIVGVAYDERADAQTDAAFLRAVVVEHEAHFPDAATLLLVVPGRAAAVTHALAHHLVVCGDTLADALALRGDADLIVVLDVAPNATKVPQGTPVFSTHAAPDAPRDLFALLRDAVFGGDDRDIR